MSEKQKSMSHPPLFSLEMRVRDYECDLQGIVNNAIYQHYLEHTRNEFLRSRLTGMETLHLRGIDTVVARLEMQFKYPLKPGNDFVCRLWVEKEGIKFVFHQDIVLLPEEKLCVRATTVVVCRINGRLQDCEELNILLP